MTSFFGWRRSCRPRSRRLELEAFEDRLCPSTSIFSSGAVLSFQDHPGFQTSNLDKGDDNSSSAVTLGFSIDFFGVKTSSLYVNNNGNVTVQASLGTFTPFNLLSTSTPIIAPF